MQTILLKSLRQSRSGNPQNKRARFVLLGAAVADCASPVIVKERDWADSSDAAGGKVVAR